jgi:hypothetical protein
MHILRLASFLVLGLMISSPALAHGGGPDSKG